LTGLDYLHSQNIIYRDLKPDNLLVSYHPRIKLADFGNVHFLPASDSVTRGLEGTISYMSPEMRMGRYYNTKTDIWSFGITMLNVLFDNNTTFPNFELGGPWAARKFAEGQLYLSADLKKFIQSLFLKAAERPSAKDLLNVLPFRNHVDDSTPL
jgi:serine/threonine protein kinase